MVQKSTYLVPGDRCGVFWVKVFHLYGGWWRKKAGVGDFIKVTVRDTKPDNKIKKKTKLAGILVRTKKEIIKGDNSAIKFKLNNVILLKRRMTPKGREIFGPIPSTVKRKKFKSSFAKIV